MEFVRYAPCMHQKVSIVFALLVFMAHADNTIYQQPVQAAPCELRHSQFEPAYNKQRPEAGNARTRWSDIYMEY